MLSSCRLIGPEELGELLGLTRQQVYKVLAAGRLPAPVPALLGRRLRWRLFEVQAWILAGCPIDGWQWDGEESEELAERTRPSPRLLTSERIEQPAPGRLVAQRAAGRSAVRRRRSG